MKTRPILFSGPMVRAILEGRKTQTRRIVKPQPAAELNPASIMWNPFNKVIQSHHDGTIIHCPYGQPGDRLWVKQDFRLRGKHTDACTPWEVEANPAHFEAWIADGITFNDDFLGKLRPAEQMPRWASRITLEITDVRVERLQDISPDDCRAEWMPADNNDIGVRYGFGQLWESNYGRGSWAANPWVWVITFKRIKEVEG